MVVVVEEVEIQNSLGFLPPLKILSDFIQILMDISHTVQFHQQEKGMKMPEGARKQKSSFWNLCLFIYKNELKTNH